jgi:hypothetical protein
MQQALELLDYSEPEPVVQLVEIKIRNALGAYRVIIMRTTLSEVLMLQPVLVLTDNEVVWSMNIVHLDRKQESRVLSSIG